MKKNDGSQDINKSFLAEPVLCCGCEACVARCPFQAIRMEEDAEGFCYPRIHPEKCTECGACSKVCPILRQTLPLIGKQNQKCYAGYLKDQAQIKKSASGGAATAIAACVIKAGGEVYGVTYTNNFRRAEYVKAQCLDDLNNLKGSKYIQSSKRDLYIDMEKSLKKNKIVLMIGLPCEIGAAKAYFGEYENLLTLELICHGPTSAKAESQFIDMIERRYHSRVVNFNVRYKKEGWTPPYVLAEFENGKRYEKPLYKTYFGYAFAVFLRPSCYHCSFKGKNRVADVTIGDFWGDIQKEKYWNHYGVSAIMVHTEKGKNLIKELENFALFEVPYDIIRAGNPRLDECETEQKKRRKFAKILAKYGLKWACIRTCKWKNIWKFLR